MIGLLCAYEQVEITSVFISYQRLIDGDMYSY